jgi:hypothetical protein
MLDLNSKFMGVARLRQQRVKPKLCQVPKAMEFLNMSCWPEFFEALHREEKFLVIDGTVLSSSAVR